MAGLTFQRSIPVVSSDPRRADIACFVGLVARRGGAAATLPAALVQWLLERGVLRSGQDPSEVADLLDVAVPVDTWDVFDELFDWESRPLSDDSDSVATTYLGAAVRSFFAQGGRKCYVVRVGNPPAYLAPRSERLALLEALLPGYPNILSPSAADRESWSGLGHLFGLPDASLVCLPDLADLVKAEPPEVDPQPPEVLLPEGFVECSAPQAPPEDTPARYLPAPRSDEEGFGHWAAAVRRAAELVARHRREMQLLAALPLPVEGEGAPPLPRLHEIGHLDTAFDGDEASLSSAFVQLAYPWLRTPGSDNMPEGLESPDGALAGLLARNAMVRGTFRSAAGLPISGASSLPGDDAPAGGDVRSVHPVLGREQRRRPHPPGEGAAWRLEERVSLFGPTPRGLTLLSDVTASLNPSYRPGGVQRLVSSLVRAARRIGEDVVFEASGERLWGRVRRRLEDVLTALFEAGALRGGDPKQAFQVRCDRSTMSQNDIDNGRVLAEVRFDAALPIDSIRVVLALDEGGSVSLAASGSGGGQEAA